MYNHENHYRCTIIRGKSQKDIDDLLPAYAKIIEEICPCEPSTFIEQFNLKLLKYMPKALKKTLDNHRTEIAGKLFGMYYHADDGFVYTSERTIKFLEDNDQPAFFKDVCFKMQFPNGMDKSTTIIDRRNSLISLRPYSYLLKILLCAEESNIILTKNNIGYYVFNSLDVLQHKANPIEVIKQIEKDKKLDIERTIKTPNKGYSYDKQHTNELINYLELANLIITNQDGIVALNFNEIDTINYFAQFWDEPLLFDIYSYNLNTIEERKKLGLDWDYYYSKVSDNSESFATTRISLGIKGGKDPKTDRTNLIEIGDEGELFVYEYEKARVKLYSLRLANKVLHLGKTKGLGYDIQSVIAEPGDVEEFVKYIEVKSTKRVTKPDINDSNWIDTINITRNEWVAAQQHGDFYSIYRVYFVRGEIIMYVIKDIGKKEKDGLVKVTPMTYKVDFNNNAIDRII